MVTVMVMGLVYKGKGKEKKKEKENQRYPRHQRLWLASNFLYYRSTKCDIEVDCFFFIQSINRGGFCTVLLSFRTNTIPTKDGDYSKGRTWCACDWTEKEPAKTTDGTSTKQSYDSYMHACVTLCSVYSVAYCVHGLQWGYTDTKIKLYSNDSKSYILI